jgi:hypothetical protein
MIKMILKNFILPILIIPLFLSSCASQEEVKCYLPSVTPTSNSPLIPGGNLQLTSPLNEDPSYSYKWTGPNGFESNLSNPIVNNVTLAMAGDYKVKKIKGICESPESITTVEISAPNIPCNPTNNTMTFGTTSLSPINFYSISSHILGDNFTITASGSRGDLRIEFYNSEFPSTAIYDISGACPTSFLKSNEVCISLVYAGQYSTAHSGKVYVSLVGGKLSAIFCDVVFDVGIKVSTSAKLTSSN